MEVVMAADGPAMHLRLYVMPAPSPTMRDAAIARALLHFDKKFRGGSQGFGRHIRLIQSTASSIQPSKGSFTMSKLRYLIAAGLIVTTGAVAWHGVPRTRPEPTTVVVY